MKLKTYIDEQGFKTIADAARDAGFEHETFRKWTNGERRPRNPEDLRKIARWTGGKVTAVDFYSEATA